MTSKAGVAQNLANLGFFLNLLFCILLATKTSIKIFASFGR